jgi:hypothetical protein
MPFPEPTRRQRKQVWLNHNEVLPGIWMIEDKASPKARVARIVFAKQVPVTDYETNTKRPGWAILGEIPKPRSWGANLYIGRDYNAGVGFNLSCCHPSADKLVELALHIFKEML